MQYVFSFCDNLAMENIIHGANPENLYREFNIVMPEKIFDFSTNTNIISWPKLEINLELLASNYPDPDCRELTNLISERENINPDRILFTNGINEAIFLTSMLFCQNLSVDKSTSPLSNGRLGILQPCYSEYSRAFIGAIDVFDIERAGDFEIFILTNPNNPTGKYFDNLSELIKRFSDTLFIIDEAYRDFLIHGEKLERLCEFENVILLRSLTKIFHLSGVRIGYVIASEKIISAMKNFQPSWSVNSIAQELALKFLNDKEFYERTRKFYSDITPKFIKSLEKANFEIMKSSVHYFLIRVENDIDVIKFLLKSGIVVRHTRNFKGLEGKYIRVATRFEDENKILVEKLKEIKS